MTSRCEKTAAMTECNNIGVKYMADFKQSLQAAQRWLHRAENEWDQKHGVRAKLHLMLAEAELKRVSGRAQGTTFTAWGGRFAALLTVLIIAGYGWWNLTDYGKEVQPTFATQAASVQASEPVAVAAPVLAETLQKKEATQAAIEPVISAEPPQVLSVKQAEATTTAIETKDVISADEMQKLVRSAGKSLRSQTKNTKE